MYDSLRIYTYLLIDNRFQAKTRRNKKKMEKKIMKWNYIVFFLFCFKFISQQISLGAAFLSKSKSGHFACSLAWRWKKQNALIQMHVNVHLISRYGISWWCALTLYECRRLRSICFIGFLFSHYSCLYVELSFIQYLTLIACTGQSLLCCMHVQPHNVLRFVIKTLHQRTMFAVFIDN